MLTSALDPTFTLSSDFYYRSLLAKVVNVLFDCIYIIFLRFMRRAG